MRAASTPHEVLRWLRAAAPSSVAMRSRAAEGGVAPPLGSAWTRFGRLCVFFCHFCDELNVIIFAELILCTRGLAKMTITFEPWRIMATRNLDGAMRATPRTPRSCDGPRGSLSMRPLGLAGQRALQARLARLCRSHRSSSDRRTTGVSPHHTMTFTDVGGRVTNGAGSSVASEWSDRARTVTLRLLPHWCGCV